MYVVITQRGYASFAMFALFKCNGLLCYYFLFVFIDMHVN